MTASRSGGRRRLAPGVAAALVALLALLALWPVSRNGFVFDDADHVLNNPLARDALRLEGFPRLFTSTWEANWHPLAWLSHALDLRLFGARAGAHHLVSLAIHCAAAAALLLVLRAYTGALWRSALAAALFAVHPLRVESVAWIAERKDVLSGLLWVATMGAYLGWVRRRGAARYALALVLFALGLMAKPMLVTLPFVLLLLDAWPLGRLRAPRAGAALRSLALEKAPFLALSAVSAAVTYRAQQSWGAVGSLADHPLGLRVANAVVASAAYLRDCFFPVGLTAFYPYPERVAAGALVLSGGALAALTAAALLVRRRAPWALAGWLWYLGTLVPVIGLVQVGVQARADRYTYLPLAGVFVALSWGLGALVPRGRRRLAALGAGVAVALFALAAHLQVSHWRDNRALFERALAVTAGNFIAHVNLGSILAEEGRTAEATRHFEEAVRINPRMDTALFNLGVLLARAGRTAEAQERYRSALALNPGNAEAHINLGLLLLAQGRRDEAGAHFRQALRPGPFQALAHANLGSVLEGSGDLDGARAHYREAVRLDPAQAGARSRLLLLEGLRATGSRR